jgi:linoleoyl-CoA desaturase
MPNTSQRVRFAERGAFARDLDAGVAAYFEKPGANRSRRDAPRMYLKTLVILAWFVGSWAALVFVAERPWQGVLAAVSLGLSIAGVGMCIQHDANHGAYSRLRWVNRLFGATLDVMGVSSFIWRPKHNVAHHTFTNVGGVDFDLDFGGLARLAPTQARRSWHRYQQLYLWFFYGFLLPKWVFFDDFVILRSRLIGVHPLPKPGRADLASFVFWKLFFVGWAIVIPLLFHPWWQVLLFHLLAAFTLGWTLGTVFQLAHCSGEAEFPIEPAERRLTTDFATHQLETTVDFAPKSRLVTWFCGGLNFQVEHHLFPKVCHVHYPALSLIVADVAARHGLRHRSQPTLALALGSHYRHLRSMGRAISGATADVPDLEAPTAPVMQKPTELLNAGSHVV